MEDQGTIFFWDIGYGIVYKETSTYIIYFSKNLA
jgi:hypothetical protein